jgi:hypothetical protein
VSELKPWIDKLNGMSTQDIYDLMVAEEIQGFCGDPERCVLAEFLRRHGVNLVTVSTDNTIDFAPGFIDDPAEADHDESLIKFIINFDENRYPALTRSECDE